MAVCEEEYQAMQDTLEDPGPGSDEYREARKRFEDCMKRERARAEGRASHAAAWDERLYQLHKEIQAAWDRLFPELRVPPRPSCGMRSNEIRSEISSTRRNAMIFSEKLEEAFRETGVNLDKDETYACLICVVKKPEYVTQALEMDPLCQNVREAPRVNYIMEPAIMKSVMNVIEEEKIDYKTKAKK